MLAHEAGEPPSSVIAKAVGCVIVNDVEVAVQLLASLTVTVYVPAAKLVKDVEAWNVVPLIEYVYGAVPPVADAVIVPLVPPKQETLVLTPDATSNVGWVIVAEAFVVQEFASVITTLKVPAAIKDKSSDVAE